MSTPRSSYKTYFRQERLLKNEIPGRTRRRLIKRTKLEPQFCAAGKSSRDNVPSLQIEDNSDNGYSYEGGKLENNYEGVEEKQIDFCGGTLGELDQESDSCSKSSYSGSSTSSPETPHLYTDARISKDESVLLIYGYILRHKLSATAASDLLTLINFHLPNNTSIPNSTFLLEKSLLPDYSVATKNFYCPSCEALVETDEGCADCNFNLSRKELNRSGNFFVSFDVKSALTKAVNSEVIGEALVRSFQKRNSFQDSNEISDIMDGQLYKKLNLREHDLTCSINTDGVSVFKSSKLSIWPVFISINELPYRLRRKFTILCGLWFGFKKPNFDTFLATLIAQFNTFSEKTMEWRWCNQAFKSFVYFPIVAADSVARCSLQGIKQFNGEYGCPWCLSKGESLKLSENSRKWVYPPEVDVLRTQKNFIGHVQGLLRNLKYDEGNNCFGVQCASQLLTLRKFDIVNGFTFDYMHTCLLGIVRMFTMTWLDSKNHAKDFYVGTQTEKISAIYSECKVPFECNRLTRELGSIAFWKANEWKTWMLMCIPVLQNIQKPVYLNHFSKFVQAIVILTADVVTHADLNIASNLIKEFCSVAPNLYGNGICSFNMHIILHCVQCVKNWGPLWGYSLFQFEHWNGVITSYFSGPNNVCMQIIKKVILQKEVEKSGQEHFANRFAKSFFNSLMDRKRFSSKAVCCESVVLLGKKKKYVFSECERKKIVDALGTEQIEGHSFHSAIVCNRRFSIIEKTTEKRVNSLCKINDLVYCIYRFITIELEGICVPIILVNRVFCKEVVGLRNVYKVKKISESQHVFRASAIQNCKYLCLYDKGSLLYISELLNNTELE